MTDKVKTMIGFYFLLPLVKSRGQPSLSHITSNSGSSVSIISVSAVNLGSHLYRFHLGHFDAVILGTPFGKNNFWRFRDRKHQIALPGWESSHKNASAQYLNHRKCYRYASHQAHTIRTTTIFPPPLN